MSIYGVDNSAHRYQKAFSNQTIVKTINMYVDAQGYCDYSVVVCIPIVQSMCLWNVLTSVINGISQRIGITTLQLWIIGTSFAAFGLSMFTKGLSTVTVCTLNTSIPVCYNSEHMCQWSQWWIVQQEVFK